jgi:hypothetical protein
MSARGLSFDKQRPLAARRGESEWQIWDRPAPDIRHSCLEDGVATRNFGGASLP